MKKRVLSFFLCATLLCCVLAPSAAAYSRPAGSAATSGVSELSVDTVAPDMSRNLAVGLTSSAAYSTKGADGSAWYAEANNMTAEEIADVADMSKYSFTVIGARALERQADAAVDGVWTTGAKGVNGAFSARPDGNLYNVNGEIGKDDSIYQMMLTMNFGYLCELDTIAFTHSYGGILGYLTACDVYVSDNGVDWTAVGYWDQPQRMMQNKGTYTCGLNSTVLGNDKLNAALTGKAYIQFALPEGTTGQYLRLAATSLEGVSPANCTDKTNYDAWSYNYVSFREMFVYGEAADVNYVGSQERTYTESETSKYDVRFLASMDDYNLYSEAGFKISADFENGIYAETGKTYTDACDYVYTALTAADGESGNIKTVSASEYHAGQMMALTIKGIPTNTGTVTFTVTPYYVLKADGTTVDAQSYTVVYNAGAFVSCTPVA